MPHTVPFRSLTPQFWPLCVVLAKKLALPVLLQLVAVPSSRKASVASLVSPSALLLQPLGKL